VIISDFNIIEALVSLNSLFMLVILWFIRKWIRAHDAGLQKIGELEIALVKEIGKLQNAILQRRVDCDRTFATKDDLWRGA